MTFVVALALCNTKFHVFHINNFLLNLKKKETDPALKFSLKALSNEVWLAIPSRVKSVRNVIDRSRTTHYIMSISTLNISATINNNLYVWHVVELCQNVKISNLLHLAGSHCIIMYFVTYLVKNWIIYRSNILLFYLQVIYFNNANSVNCSVRLVVYFKGDNRLVSAFSWMATNYFLS